MAVYLGVVYSPLCDTDSTLYDKYLSLVSKAFDNNVEGIQCGSTRSTFIANFQSRAELDLGRRAIAGLGSSEDRHRDDGGKQQFSGPLCVDDSEPDIAIGECIDGHGGEQCKEGVAFAQVNACSGSLEGSGSSAECRRIHCNFGAGGIRSGVGPNGGKSFGRGANYARNTAARARKRAMAGNWRVSASALPVENCGGDSPVSNGGSGFWNSCSSAVRQELIDSKAQMHIAANKRKAEEDERRFNQLRSPEQLLKDAMRMVDFANERAKKASDSKVAGWARTVANSYAESIARSASDSVESFDKYSQTTASETFVSSSAYEVVCTERDQLKNKVLSREVEVDNRVRDLELTRKRIAELESQLEKVNEQVRTNEKASYMRERKKAGLYTRSHLLPNPGVDVTYYANIG